MSAHFRAQVPRNTVEFLKHGAAYFPYLDTDIPFAIAGVYAQVDRSRGVWKAPANLALSRVSGQALR